ncbi:hypothetical protein Bhyg_01105 [Pseudolycoriella hygida]|uniref:Uncharacterized protein n=1 Tax=Pseudolycoriella hygida TaxID=35572 RepID=A0A9Q0N8Q4_9DIPT|nr:hypothetical protein Bhyg_01105 [Pseudolycoriella hygida]
MEKTHVSKHPSLDAISEHEPHSYNSHRSNYNNATHVQFADDRIYKPSTNRSPPTLRDSHINQGYNGNSQSSINRDGSTPSVGGVYREQYWICSEPLRCRNWTKRERILFFVLLGLSTVVLGLVAVISFISRNSKENTEAPPNGWFPWL